MNTRPRTSYDAVVIGAGPNGLCAAIELTRAGLSTLVCEGHRAPGGGARTAELTLPGFAHDVCSAVHPLGVGSPFMKTLDLRRAGLTWVHSPAPLAHVLRDGRVITLERSIDATAQQLGRDGPAYRRLLAPFVERFDELMPMALGPLHIPSSPWLYARFGAVALWPMRRLARTFFSQQPARALLAGIAAHSMVPLDSLATASFALMLGCAGHAVGWPIAAGGSQALSDALCVWLRAQGGEIELGRMIDHIEELPPARAYLFDVTPKQLLSIAGERLPARYRRRLRHFRYGPGVYKVDWALREPIPWRNAACARAATVHLSGTLDDIMANDSAIAAGRLAADPFTLVVQPSLFDGTRAPAGMHTAWAYCHVPSGSALDACAAIEAHIERFAPGFREVILGRSQRSAVDIEAYNPNYVGGDINGGLADLAQLFFRPVFKLDPYATPARDIFLCSSSTPPGGGVHGMCGYWAARSALHRAFGLRHHSIALASAPKRPQPSESRPTASRQTV